MKQVNSSQEQRIKTTTKEEIADIWEDKDVLNKVQNRDERAQQPHNFSPIFIIPLLTR